MAKATAKKNIPEAVAEHVRSSATWNKKLVFILGLVSLLVYANTLNNGYVLDDFIVIKNNTIVSQGISAIPEILVTPYHKGNYTLSNDLYRPLSLVMFAIEYQLFDGSPTGSHFINILLFAGCVILLFLFFDNLFDEKRTIVAFVAALLFALHPIHTEVVANIKSRDELLCFFLGFLALNRFLKYMDTGKMSLLITGTACLFLALLSKETAITLVVVVPLVFFFYKGEHKKRSISITIGAVIAAAVFLTIRFAVLNAHHAGNISDIAFIDNPLVQAPFATRLATGLLILGYYIKLLFIPYPLICDYSYNSIPFASFGNMGALLSLVIYLFLLGFSIYLLSKNRKDPFAFGMLFFLITISLFSNIPFLIGAMMAERFVFFASAGFCLLVALIINKFLGQPADTTENLLNNKKVTAAVGIIALAYAAITINRNNDWQSNTTLFTADSKKAPNSSRLYYYLGTDLIIAASDGADPATRQQLSDDGVLNLKKSLAIYPEFPMAAAQIGHVYFANKQYDSAELYNKIALVQDPRDTSVGNTLAAIYFYAQRYQQSIDVCKRCVAIFPDYIRGYTNIGSCHQHLNNYDSAVYYFKRVLSISPTNYSTYDRLAKAYTQMGNLDSAKKYLELAKQNNYGMR